MRTVEFKTKDLIPLVEHTQKHTGTSLLAYAGDKTATEDSLWLVKDHGVYLMVNTKKNLMDDHGNNVVVYADGLNPAEEQFDDWWSRASEFSGDDFVENLPLEWFVNAIRDGARRCLVTLENDTIRFETKQPTTNQQDNT